MENSDNQNKANYHIPAFVDEQIKLAEMELDQFERECAAKINFRRGAIHALQQVKAGEPVVARAPN